MHIKNQIKNTPHTYTKQIQYNISLRDFPGFRIWHVACVYNNII